MNRGQKKPWSVRSLIAGGVTLAALLAGGPPVHADGTQTLAREQKFDIARPPAWVVPVEAEPDSSPAQGKKETGEYLLLIDTQENSESHETFRHIARMILNSSGVQEGAQVSMQFDPSFQRLIIHSIKIHRGTETLDRLDADKIKVIQQERELERHIYNGALSAVLFLEDVRPGDWVEYSYTVKGTNPILRGHFADFFYARWMVPVHQQQFRLVWGGGRELHIKNHGVEIQPVIRRSGSTTEYVWQFKDTSATTLEDTLPVWYDAFPWVQLSDFNTWREVAFWAEPMYRVAEPLPPDLQEKIATWKSKFTTPEDRILAALHFVQDDVRYLAIEFGPHSHQPTPPATVYERRFGDCKDKTFLFCAMLQAMDIEAHPTLVNTLRRHTISDWQPSPYAFNHVITEVKLNGKNLWVDPTRAFQRGPLESLPISPFERGLVVGQKTVGLATIVPGTTEESRKVVVKTYRVLDYTNPVALTIETTFSGTRAEQLRASVAQSGSEALEKSYLNYYAKYHPKIEVARPMEIKDMPERNAIVLTQHYRVAELWQLSENKERWLCQFYPQSIYDSVRKPYTLFRSMPLGIDYPVRVMEICNVFLPEHFSLTNGVKTVSDDAMNFSVKVQYRQSKLTLTYDYETLTDALPAAEVPEHLKNLDRMAGELGYTLQRNVLGSPGIRVPYRPNWPVWILAIMYGMFLLAGIIVLCRYRPGNYAAAPPVIGSKLNGIGGWLIVMAFTLGLRLLLVGWTIGKINLVFSLGKWELLAVPGHASYHPLWAPILIYELLANLTIFAGCILVTILFFWKAEHLSPFLSHPAHCSSGGRID